MFQEKYSIEIISRLTKLSVKEIKQLELKDNKNDSTQD